MKTEKRIFAAFLLNLFFSAFELVGGVLTGSVAIGSDALHDLGDAISIGISFALEKKSKREPDSRYSYGYARFSVLGGAVSSLLLLFGAAVMLVHSFVKMTEPQLIDCDGMFLLSLVGICVNFAGAYLTAGKSSLNQRAVSLHMIEDVLGWVAVLISSVVIKLTQITVIDTVLSVVISVFIMFSAFKNLVEAIRVLLDSVPRDTDIEKIKNRILGIDAELSVEYLCIRSIDDVNSRAEVCIISDSDVEFVKKEVRRILCECGVGQATIETRRTGESFASDCEQKTPSRCAHAHRHFHFER